MKCLYTHPPTTLFDPDVVSGLRMVIMNENYAAFEVRFVPIPGPDATAPELSRGLCSMPMFVIIPAANLAE